MNVSFDIDHFDLFYLNYTFIDADVHWNVDWYDTYVSLVPLSRWQKIYWDDVPTDSPSLAHMKIGILYMLKCKYRRYQSPSRHDVHNLYRMSDDITINLRWMMERSGPLGLMYDTTINSGCGTEDWIYIYILYQDKYHLGWVSKNVRTEEYVIYLFVPKILGILRYRRIAISLTLGLRYMSSLSLVIDMTIKMSACCSGIISQEEIRPCCLSKDTTYYMRTKGW